jgi:endonuclease G, mitochondrial
VAEKGQGEPVAVAGISLQTKIAYPRSVSAGETYLLSIDLDHDIRPEDWPYADEEYPVTCFVDAAPYFTQKAESDSTVIVSRFGGSYGPARFWLTARKMPFKSTAAKVAKPSIDVLLVNANGMPIHRVLLNRIELRELPVLPAPPKPPVGPQRSERGQVPKRRTKTPQIEQVPEGIFRWMHLGDLQLRGDSRDERPNVAREACEWVKATGNRIHAVIVSGDISFSGQPAEFQQASRFLGNLTSSLADVQPAHPRLIVVPGNHDRTPDDSLALPASARWSVDSAQRQQFWTDSTRRLDVQRAFEPFAQWSLGMETLGGNSNGLLPGDFARDLTVDGLKVGIVGLNDCVVVPPWHSTRADVHPVQLQRVCGDVGSWSQRYDLRILITHHHPDSLLPELYKTFYRNFAPRALFDIHLFGSTKYESRHLRTNKVGAETSAALNAARLNGRYPQGFQIGEALVRGHEVNVRSLSFVASRSRAKFTPAPVQTTKLSKRTEMSQFASDVIEDNMLYVLPAPVLSTSPVVRRRAILVGLDKLKVSPTATAIEALSKVLVNLGFQDEQVLQEGAQRKQIFAALQAAFKKSEPADLLVYFCAQTPPKVTKTSAPHGERLGNVTSDELFELARKAGRRLLILGDIAKPTEVPPGCGIIRQLAMRMKIAKDRYGVAAVIGAFRERLASHATIAELYAAIVVGQNFNRRPYRVWIRAHLTEEAANLTIGGTPSTAAEASSSSATGYAPDFLGFAIPLPRLERTFPPAGVLLHYLHFSVLLNPQRRLAWFGAVNVDFQERLKDDKEIDWERWRYEPRVPRAQQLEEEVFHRSGFDHARLVKRMMPAWGEPALAGDAFGDTGHYTNLMPLMSEANQNQIWRALPDHILKHHAHGQRMSFFSGPLFSENDPVFRGVQIPVMCWMVFAFTDHIGRPISAAFLTSQLGVRDVRGREAPEFSRSLPKTPQVTRIPLSELRQIGGLDFGVLHDFDISANEPRFRGENALPGTLVSSVKNAIPYTAPHGNITRPASQGKRPKRAKTRAKRK